MHKDDHSSPNNEKIRKKIASLLEKTAQNGATEDEATAAMKVATKLMEEYGITLEEIKKSKKEDFAFAVFNEGRRNLHEVDLYGVSKEIANFTDTEVYSAKNCGKVEVVFFGYEKDTILGEYLRDVCRMAMEAEWKKYSKNNVLKGHKRSHRKNFLIGMSDRITERLREIKNQHVQETTGTELVVAKSQAVNNALRENNIVVKAKSRKTYYDKDETFSAGKNAGNNVNLGNPIKNTTKDKEAIC